MADEKPKAKTRRDGLYVHPRGSLAKQLKVSCASCISGHRSGECNHFDRILLQIRAAGRPSNTCHHSSSCGGACLKQKAFVIPGGSSPKYSPASRPKANSPLEEPRWCRDHRSCIENWEYSDHCPPYPVSSKRKAQSPSPKRESETTSTAGSGHKGTNDCTPTSRPTAAAAAASCCSSGSKAGTSHSRAGPNVPFRQPVMVTASSNSTSSTWVPKSESVQSPFTSTFEPLSHHLMLPLASESLSASHNQMSNAPFLQPSGLPYFDPFDVPYAQIPTKPTSTYAIYNRYMDDSARYHDDFSTVHHNDDLSASFTLPATTVPASTTSYSTAAALTATPIIQPQEQWKRHKQDEPQQCPGNGFQCPCDENCMCVDCYTHGRGFWTLPVALGDAQEALSEYQEDRPPPPTQISRSISQDNSRRPDLHYDAEHEELSRHGHRQFVDPQDLFNLEASPSDY